MRKDIDMPSNLTGWVLAGVGFTIGAALGTMLIRAIGLKTNGA